MINGYTYSHMNSVYWYCSSKSQGSNLEIIKIPTPSGKFLLMVDGYTYNQNNGIHWLCSSFKTQKCRARIRYFEDTVLKVNTDHTHPPPKYYHRRGMYFKV
ncbi:unnamed protein product [Pieris macdunnoughi]|uniref:FLYWCH-type domain-containing protein n=1 Tax=Pieris macdunnoughi TaxID=345717 RepID=A0A821Q8I4_9NEOP|nr:unnamed protein product [Pieris macdunnoughi]